MEDDRAPLSLTFSSRDAWYDPQDPDYYVSGIDVEFTVGDDGGDDYRIGSAHLHHFRMGDAMNEGVSYVGVFDSEQEHVPYFSLWERLYEGEFDHTDYDVLVISRFEIDEQYQRKGLGSICLARLLMRLSGTAALVALEACPYNADELPVEERIARKAQLRRFYKRLGFESMGDGHFPDHHFLVTALSKHRDVWHEWATSTISLPMPR